MKNPLRSERSFDLGLLAARLPMGAFFLIAGCTKIFSIGVDNFVNFASHSGHVPHAVPPEWVHTYLHTVPFLELAVGLMLVLGLFARLGGFVGALMVISFTVGYTRLHGTSPSDQALPFHPNFIYLGLFADGIHVGAGPDESGRFTIQAPPGGRCRVKLDPGQSRSQSQR
jgi:uncharacterized membrane protein YphA (DoxX/SURF4 family)